jgi:tryptophanyl-tRNA synthetase
MAETPNTEAFYFLADYHALIKCQEPERIARSTLEIAAAWLALGLDPERVHFYRQSDIREIPELTWLLTCVAAKGLLNRAHAYKASVDYNIEQSQDADAGITMGLYSYPVLMAADILMFEAHKVPVGRDQVQHIEIARDLAQRFNHLYGTDLVLPEAVVDEAVATLPGLDGRKMSKSYDNTIGLFLSESELRKAISRIVTNALLPGEAKDPESSHLVTIYNAFADEVSRVQMHADLRAGLSWGEAKTRTFNCINQHLAAARERYQTLLAHPQRVEEILRFGAEKAAKRSKPLIEKLKSAMGLRSLVQAAGQQVGDDPKAVVDPSLRQQRKQTKTPRLVEFKGKDGLYYFKLLSSNGRILFESHAFSDSAALLAAKPAWPESIDDAQAESLAVLLRSQGA